MSRVQESYVDRDAARAAVAVTPENVLAVARAHTGPAAARWAGWTPQRVAKLRRDVDGYRRGPGRSSRVELAAQRPRLDCGCAMCTEWRSDEMVRSNLRHAATRPEVIDLVRPAGAWAARAACRGQDTRVFFVERGEPTTEARRLCATCPVRDDCLDYALAANITFGIWGGTSPLQRRQLQRTRRRTAA